MYRCLELKNYLPLKSERDGKERRRKEGIEEVDVRWVWFHVTKEKEGRTEVGFVAYFKQNRNFSSCLYLQKYHRPFCSDSNLPNLLNK